VLCLYSTEAPILETDSQSEIKAVEGDREQIAFQLWRSKGRGKLAALPNALLLNIFSQFENNYLIIR
jgi:hypothetical protein